MAKLTKPSAGTALVKVTGQALFEAGERHEKGATFTSTVERAAALGDHVEIVSTAGPAEEAPPAP